MKISIDAAGLEDARKALEGIPGGIERATSRAVNRAILAARTEGTKDVGKEYVIRASDVKANMTIKKAGAGDISAALSVKGSAIDIQKFKVKVKKSGIFVQVKRSGGAELPHSFFVTTNGLGIYHRQESSRLPIQKEWGPSMPQMIGNPAIIEAMSQKSQEAIEKRLPHEVNAILGGFAK